MQLKWAKSHLRALGLSRPSHCWQMPRTGFVLAGLLVSQFTLITLPFLGPNKPVGVAAPEVEMGHSNSVRGYTYLGALSVNEAGFPPTTWAWPRAVPYSNPGTRVVVTFMFSVVFWALSLMWSGGNSHRQLSLKWVLPSWQGGVSPGTLVCSLVLPAAQPAE